MPAPERSTVVRRAVADDVPTIHHALTSLAIHVGGKDHFTSTADDLLTHGFGDTPRFAVDIAEIGHVFAGLCIHFPIYSTWMGVPGVFVQDLYVEDRFRGLKVGETLLRHVARASQKESGGYLRLSVDIDNLDAQAFYNRLGIFHSDCEQIHKVTGAAFDAFCDGRATPRPPKEPA